MSTRPRSAIDHLEETLIAFILAAMTVITFANVIARKSFDLVNWLVGKGILASAPKWVSGNILWASESTVFLFAWLVLLGASYAVKHGTHLGVDVIINAVSPARRKVLALLAVGACLLFTLFLCKAAWDYWSVFANLPPTSGRWIPLGFEEKFRGRGWYEVDDIPMPALLAWMKDIFNDGDAYEKIPRLIPYFVLPLSMGLMMLRYLQALARLLRGQQDRVIVSHEVEDQIDSAAARAAGER